MKLNWNFLGGAGCKTKDVLPLGEYGCFLELLNPNLQAVKHLQVHRDSRIILVQEISPQNEFTE